MTDYPSCTIVIVTNDLHKYLGSDLCERDGLT